MKTFHLDRGTPTLHIELKAEPPGTKYFVIGVKNSSLDVDNLVHEFNVEKLGEVVNPRYICTNDDGDLDEETYNEHILQPAFISLKKGK